MDKMINLLSVLFFCGILLASCQDEEIPAYSDASRAASDTKTTYTEGSLKQNADGTWQASSRVPLIGPGRIVNLVGNGLLSAVGSGDCKLENLMDIDLTNAASFSGSLLAVELGVPIVSVKDMYRVYKAGQKAGFIYRPNAQSGKLLGAEVLKGFWLEFYREGVKVGSAASGGGSGGVLGLDLLTLPSTGKGDLECEIAATCDVDFDEVRMGTIKVDVNLLDAIEVCYAFVGDNPEIPAVTGNSWFDDGAGLSVPDKFNVVDAENVIDPDKHATYADVLVSISHSVKVDFGKDIPANYEVGFYFNETNVLDLGLLAGSTSLSSYSPEGEKLQTAGGNLSVLSLKLLSGGRQKISMVAQNPFRQAKLQFAGGLKTAGGEIYNAYLRKPVELDPTNFFSMAGGETTRNYYNLPVPQKGTVTYELVEQPAGASAAVSPSGKRVVGMRVPGDYKIRATYRIHIDGTEHPDKELVQEVVVTKTVAAATTCNQWITHTSRGAVVTSPVDHGSGCLLCLPLGTEGVNNIVDDDYTNYQTYTGLLDLASNIPVTAIRMDTPVTPSQEGGKVRTGFVLQASKKLLNLGALQFFRIRLYKGNTEVDKGTADENTTVGVGLLGSDEGKIRYSIETDQEFDRIELWTSGVLDLGLVKQLRIYGAFYEPADAAGCENLSIGDACMEMMNPVNAGLDIDYEHLKLGSGILGVGNVFADLEHILDGDKTSGALGNTTLGLLSGSTLALRFCPVEGNQTVGVLLQTTGSIANADVISAMTVKLFHGSVPIADTGTGGVADVDVISHGGYTTIELTPFTTVDRVEITTGSLLSALKDAKVCGVFLRPDTDGDGIPDCAEDEGEDESEDLAYVGISEHQCEARDAAGARTGKGTVSVYVSGGKPGTSYTLFYYAVEGVEADGQQRTVTVPLQEKNGKRYFELELPVGEYYIGIGDASPQGRAVYNGAHAVVHPLQTLWLGTVDTGWNTWGNWSEGSPWGCTDVIIPSPSDSPAIAWFNGQHPDATPLRFGGRYPVLAEQAENQCAGIHFEPGAEVVHTHRLTYDAAWVDFILPGGGYRLLSAPLKEMATGDLFVGTPTGGTSVPDTYFTRWTDANYPVNRFYPRIYQRFWSKSTYGMTASNTPTAVGPGETHWTAPFNAVRQRYDMGCGFSVRPGAETDNGQYTFLLPKYHSQYWYYKPDGNPTSIYEDLSVATSDDAAIRTGRGGRFIYEPETGTPAMPVSVELKNEAGTDFLAGNPFMTHVNIARFLAGNSASVASIKLEDGAGGYVSLRADGSGGVTSSDGQTYTSIAPLQGFLVEGKGETRTCAITYTEAMLESGALTARAVHRFVTPGSGGSLCITVRTPGGGSSSCLVEMDERASDGVRPGEDTRILLDRTTGGRRVAVYTLSEGQALDIQRLGSGSGCIPVGVYCAEKTEVTLCLDGTGQWNNGRWRLVDTRDGKSYILRGGLELAAGGMHTDERRFYLEKVK